LRSGVPARRIHGCDPSGPPRHLPGSGARRTHCETMTFKHLRLVLLVLVACALPWAAGAQSVAQQIAAGDRAREARNPTLALAYYEAAIASEPGNYDALWRASRESADLGEAEQSSSRRSALFAAAEDYARRAVAANPQDAEGHFAMARALGRTALTLGSRQRVR